MLCIMSQTSPPFPPRSPRAHRRISRSPRQTLRLPVSILRDLRGPSLYPMPIAPVARLPAQRTVLAIHVTALPLYHWRSTRTRSATPTPPAAALLQSFLLPVQPLGLRIARTAVDNVRRLDETLWSAGVSTFLDLSRDHRSASELELVDQTMSVLLTLCRLWK